MTGRDGLPGLPGLPGLVRSGALWCADPRPGSQILPVACSAHVQPLLADLPLVVRM